MTEQNQISIQQKEEKSTARKNAYLSYIERFPLVSTLLVLKEYEDKELYEECAIIKKALQEYKTKYETKLGGLEFPMHLSVYEGKEHQDLMRRLNLDVEKKKAQEKATLIKLNLPVK